MEITVTKSVIWNGDNHLSKNIYSTFLYQVPDPDDETAVEYTRTDVFIERACEFIEQNVTGYIDVTHKGGDENVTLQSEFVNYFKEFMKGE